MAKDLRVLSAADVDRISSSFLPEDLQCLMAEVFVSISRSRLAATSDSSRARTRTRPGTQTPHRLNIAMENHTALFMPARFCPPSSLGDQKDKLQSAGSDETTKSSITTSMKIVSVPGSQAPREVAGAGLPATTVILDERTGSVRAIVNARKLTALRNAAGSLLSSTLLLSQNRGRLPKHIVAFGAGNQIEAHLELYLRFFNPPNTPECDGQKGDDESVPEGKGGVVEKCTIVNRSGNDRAKGLIGRLSSQFEKVVFELVCSAGDSEEGVGGNAEGATATASKESSSERVERALRTADLVICATSARQPLFRSEWVRDGTHIVLVGSYTPEMKEVEGRMVERALQRKSWTDHEAGKEKSYEGSHSPASLLVDSSESCLVEAGELIEMRVKPEEMVEIGEVVPRLQDGRGVDMDALRDWIRKSIHRAARTHDQGAPSEGWDGPITVFKSVGVGLQDVVVARAVVDQAERLGMGTVVRDYDAA
ncbi:hypothetical protein CC1G_04761 [Coprinopsis cinerea okayama7|uniref:Ornithine cyclodeaminase n=1 Tax=Coprinopsis cinerea (strain Okayama-7 / 130 / ATCC MYA-4618 / FGSC 9003) TaxID=240176 RepID=A8P2G8_COPC7|nr:hypothetical protein CC1G_04761 [Coprinopsis cinerea okayama7\|eukprot:XP_001838317.1 hypothetical protein CC1G_04761 [Coprinopsis cinerea okayama7\